MSLKRIAVVVALLAPLVAPVVLGADAAAQSDEPTPPETCRQLDEAGILDRPDIDLTRGECVNILKGPSNPEASNRFAGSCSFPSVQEFFGATNKGQCIVAEHAADSD